MSPQFGFVISPTPVIRAEGTFPIGGVNPFNSIIYRWGWTSSQEVVKYRVWGIGSNPANASDFVGGVSAPGSPLLDETIVFNPYVSSMNITIPVRRDWVIEPHEDFIVQLYYVSNGYLGTIPTPSNPEGGLQTSALGRILNDDKKVILSAVDATRPEGQSGPVAFRFRATRIGDTSGVQSVQWRVMGDGTATSADASDFGGNVLPSGRINFVANQTIQDFFVIVAGDKLVESNEGFLVELFDPSDDLTIETATASGTIFNDDALVSWQTTSFVREEGNSGATTYSYTAIRSGDTSRAQTVQWLVTGSAPNPANASDFVGVLTTFGTIAFAPGETSKTINIDVAGDRTYEKDEVFTVQLYNPSSGLTIGTGTASGTILNDDTPTVSLSALSATKAEGNLGATFFTFLATRSIWSAGAQSVQWRVIGDGTVNSATAGDFAGNILPSGTINFVPNQTTQAFSVVVAGDKQVENNEGFLVELFNPANGLTIETATAAGTILNDDAIVSWQTTSLAKTEGDTNPTTYSYTAIRSGDTGSAQTVQWAVIGRTDVPGDERANAADFVGGFMPFGTIAFAPGETEKTISFDVAPDIMVEKNESFAVRLYNAYNPMSGLSIGTATATGTILTDDSLVAIEATSAVRTEGQSGSTVFSFTARRSGDTSSAQSVEWSVLDDGTPLTVDNRDFVGGVLPFGKIEFLPGQTSKTLEIEIVGDKNVEENEGFLVELSNPSSGLKIDSAMAAGVILNDDAEVSLVSSASNLEGDQGASFLTFLAERSGETSSAQALQWRVVGDGTLSSADAKDFAGGVMPSGSLYFVPNQTSQIINIPVVGDRIREGDEGFQLELYNPSTGLTIGNARATGTILDDDSKTDPVEKTLPTLSIQALNANSAYKAEGNPAGADVTNPFTFRVTRSNVIPTLSTNFQWDVQGGSALPSDFENNEYPSGIVSWAYNGPGYQDITVNVKKDFYAELNETFQVIISNPWPSSQPYQISTPSALGTILNDDAQVSLSADSASRSEGLAGSKLFTFKVTRTSPTVGAHTVDWKIDWGNSQANSFDFNGPTQGTVLFSGSQNTQNININVRGDGYVENNESFTVVLLNPSPGLTIQTGYAYGTILNDDINPWKPPAELKMMSAPVANDPVFTSSSGYTLGADEFDLTYTGADAFYGEGNDFDNTIFGGPNDDLLFGRGGRDMLTGGLGRDVFRFDAISDSVSGTDRDVITDFISGVDKLDFSNFADANELLLGRQSFAFIGSNDFSGAGGELRFDPVNSLLSGDTNGSRSANFEIMLNGVGGLSANDFKLGNV